MAIEGGEHTCLTSLLICPTFTRKLRAAIHSFVLNLVSRAKSCKCVTSRSITYVSRGSDDWELMVTVFSVMLSMFKSFIGGTVICVESIAAVLVRAELCRRWERRYVGGMRGQGGAVRCVLCCRFYSIEGRRETMKGMKSKMVIKSG
jgi:hypothetical protein